MGRLVYFDMAAIAIVLILLFSLIFRGMTRGRVNRLFILLLVIILLNTIYDAASTYSFDFIEDPNTRNNIQMIISTLYYVFRISEGPIYFIFIAQLTGFWSRFTRKPIRCVLFLLPFVSMLILLIVNLFTEFLFYYTPEEGYTRGGMIALVYIVGAIYLGASFILLLITRKKLDRDKFMALLSIYPLEILAMTVQYFEKDYLLEMFSMSIMAMLVTDIVLRPEENIDFTTGARSYNAFAMDIRRYQYAEVPIHLILVRLKNDEALISILGNEPHSELLRSISSMLSDSLSGKKPKKINRFLYYLYSGLYAIIIEGKERDEYAALESRAILDQMQSRIHSNHLDLDPDVSVGTVKSPDDIDNWEDLITFANSFDRLAPDTEVMIYSDLSPDKQFRMVSEIDGIIGRALQNNSFVVYYQPIYDVKKQSFSTAEALVRLIDEKEGVISPGIFIPAAEKNGTIHRIGDFVMQTVCRFISENHLSDLHMQFIEVNLSTVQCMRNSLVERIYKVMTDFSIDPNNLNLEVTETASNFVYDTVKANILSLHSMGLDFALDDYGTGYSNLQRVVDMPFKVIKLDKSFVDEWENPRMRAVIENTIHMLKDIGNEIVVEGVETREAAEWFSGQGCDYIQGFYYAKPMPEKEFLEFIRINNHLDKM